MKKLTLLFLSMMLVFASFAGTTANAAEDITIFVNGEELITDVPPMMMNDRTMIPLRAVTEAVGCRVEWFADDQRVEVYLPVEGEPMIMRINDPTVIVNRYNGETGESYVTVETIDAPPIIINNRTFVPLRFIAETIGFEVEWDGDTNTVYLHSMPLANNTSDYEDVSLTVSNWPVDWDMASAGDVNDDITFKTSSVDGIVGLFIFKITGDARPDSTMGPDVWVDGIKGTVAGIEGIDASAISCTYDEALSERYTYPIYRLQYVTGSDIDTDSNTALFFPMDSCDFLVQIQIDAQSADIYSADMEDWFNNLSVERS